MKIFPAFLLSFVLFTTCFSQKTTLSEGKWIVNLIPNDSVVIPFYLKVDKDQKNQYQFSIINGEEHIQIVKHQIKNDSLFIDLPIFNSELKIQILDSYNFYGKWYNYAKGDDYEIQVSGNLSNKNRFDLKPSKKNLNFSGKYQVVFSKDDPWVAIGLFKQKKDKITGTFLTETGDFRFLEGNVSGNEVHLSCFDGSHAFYFNGTLINDTIKGSFYSGNHYKTDWVAVKNADYQIRNSDSITKTINESAIHFSLYDLDSNLYQFPNERCKNKVTILQIMGSWCPNCMDETNFYKDLYSKYHDQGLEIIAVAFETPKDFHSKARMLKKLKNHFNIQYKILIGGDASKKIASEVFHSLNSVVSFPTSIFIDRNNEIRRIHTGFNGPGTNKHYKEYVKKTHSLVENLLKE